MTKVTEMTIQENCFMILQRLMTTKSFANSFFPILPFPGGEVFEAYWYGDTKEERQATRDKVEAELDANTTQLLIAEVNHPMFKSVSKIDLNTLLTTMAIRMENATIEHFLWLVDNRMQHEKMVDRSRSPLDLPNDKYRVYEAYFEKELKFKHDTLGYETTVDVYKSIIAGLKELKYKLAASENLFNNPDIENIEWVVGGDQVACLYVDSAEKIDDFKIELVPSLHIHLRGRLFIYPRITYRGGLVAPFGYNIFKPRAMYYGANRQGSKGNILEQSNKLCNITPILGQLLIEGLTPAGAVMQFKK